jgi:thiosulfate dehydrogenase [quinone] large subunit
MPTTNPPTADFSSAKVLGFATLRLAMGMSMLVHGAGRFPKIGAFSAGMVKEFAGSQLPGGVVNAFAHLTPFAEFFIGASVLLGLATKWGLAAGGLWMVLLIFGSTLIEKYDIVGLQLIYSLIFFQLLLHLQYNALSVDRLMAKRRRD